MTENPGESQAAEPQATEGPDTPRDPVTGTTGNATGEEQAEENEERDPVG